MRPRCMPDASLALPVPRLYDHASQACSQTQKPISLLPEQAARILTGCARAPRSVQRSPAAAESALEAKKTLADWETATAAADWETATAAADWEATMAAHTRATLSVHHFFTSNACTASLATKWSHIPKLGRLAQKLEMVCVYWWRRGRMGGRHNSTG